MKKPEDTDKDKVELTKDPADPTTRPEETLSVDDLDAEEVGQVKGGGINSTIQCGGGDG